MFVTRLISGIVLVALALLFIITGGDLLLGVMLVLSLIGMFELYRIFDVEKKLPGILGYLAAVAYYLDLRFKFTGDNMVIMLAFLILLLPLRLRSLFMRKLPIVAVLRASWPPYILVPWGLMTLRFVKTR